MRIIRSQPDGNFTIIPNEALRDDRLSYTARGVLHELLSHRSGWETNADVMSARARQKRGAGVGEGRRAIRAAFAELEASGYMVRMKERIPAGQPGAGRVVTTLWVYDTPQHRGTADGTSAGGTSVSGTPVTGMSVSGTSSITTVEEDGDNTIENRAGEEHSTALASARAGQQASEQDRGERLNALYCAANQLDDVSLRRLLLAFEQKRKQVYRDCRNAAIDQLRREDPGALKGPHAARETDLLSYKYALQHYADKEELPKWLTTLPGPRRVAS